MSECVFDCSFRKREFSKNGPISADASARAPAPMAHDVFISYSSKDRLAVTATGAVAGVSRSRGGEQSGRAFRLPGKPLCRRFGHPKCIFAVTSIASGMAGVIVLTKTEALALAIGGLDRRRSEPDVGKAKSCGTCQSPGGNSFFAELSFISF